MISLGNMIRRIRRIGMGTMTTPSINRVVEITRRVSRSFQPLSLHHLVFYHLRTGLTIRVQHQALSVTEVFQAPRLTSLCLSVVRTIHASVSQEKKVVFGVVSLVTA